MFEAIPIRRNEVDEAWIDKFFDDAFAVKPPLASISGQSQTPAPKKYIRSSALPSRLVEQVEQTYADILGDGEFVFVTIHQDLLNLRRRLRNRHLPAPRLGKKLIDLIDAKFPAELAYEEILKDFFACLERELCCYVRSVRVYENDGKTYRDGAAITHVHMCIALPDGRSYHRVGRALHDLYSRLIYQVPLPVEFGGERKARGNALESLKCAPTAFPSTKYLDVIRGRVDEELSHPNYSVKQIVSEPVLRMRLHSSRTAKEMKGGKF